MKLFEETSITFGTTNSYRDLGLITKETPFVALPEPRLDLRDVDGMSGKLDYTNVLDSKVRYKNRTGSWTFISIEDYMTTWKKVYSALHGKVFYVCLSNDSNYLYHGRVTVDEPSSNGYKTTIKVNYDFEPYRIVNPDADLSKDYGLDTYSKNGQGGPNTAKFDWLWNDLFDNTIYYGKFDVSGSKWRNLINPGSADVVPSVTVSSPMTVNFGSKTINLITGKNVDSSLTLLPGDNVMKFTGDGTVNVDYTIGDQL